MVVHRLCIFLCFILFSSCIVAENLVQNPSFEDGSNSWISIGNGFSIDHTFKHQGKASLLCTAPNKQITKGAYQVIDLDQTTSNVVTISGWARSEGLKGQGSISIYADLLLMDGTWVRGVKANFNGRAYGWESASVNTNPGPIKQVWIFVKFEGVSGSVWFDDISVTELVRPTESPLFTRAASSTAKSSTTSTSAKTSTSTSAKTSTTSTSSKTSTTSSTGKSTTSTSSKTSTSSTSAKTSSTSTSSKTSTSSTSAKGTTSSTTSVATTSVSTTGVLTDSYYYLGLKYLFITDDLEDIRLDVANLTLDALGVTYDVILVPYTGPIPLTDASGNGLYQGIVYATDLRYNQWAPVGTPNLTIEQEAQISSYQVQFNVRRVIMNMFPDPTYGVSYVTSTGNGFDVYFATAAAPYISGYNHSARFTTLDTEIWSFGSSITNSALATPALNLTYAAGGEYVAAAFVVGPSGESQLQFYIDQATWSAHAVGLGNFWFQYLSHNIYVGSRRIFLNMQLDDLFMDSDQWDIASETQPNDTLPNGDDNPIYVSYRINASDVTFVSLWQNNTKARLPAGSNVTISWPFNGATVLDYGGYTVDTLFITVKSLLNQFVYQSHTYDHPELDALTYAQVKAELTDNFAVTLQLFGGYNHPRYSNNSMVTPSISGIFNGNALHALWDVGIKNIVGDNSRPELLPTFAYHGVWTTNATNGFAGTYIVPREATYIYYNTNLPEQVVSEYNHLYRSYYGGNSTFDQILAREADRVALLLLAFRIDPYMFHQGNARSYYYNGARTFLTAHWADHVLDKYLSYYTLPVYSHVQDLISQKWKDRETRDACGFKGQIKVDNTTKTIVGVQGTATASCTIGISGATIASPPTGVTVETYGPDKTVWYPVSPSHPLTYFNLATPIPL